MDDIAGGTSYLPGVGRQDWHFNMNAQGQGDSRRQHFETAFAAAVKFGRTAAEFRALSEAHPENVIAKMWASQFEWDAMRALGMALHALQDIDGHGAPYVKEEMGVKYHDSNQLNGKANEADNTHGGTDPRYQHTEQATKGALRRYQDAVGR